MPAIGPVGTTNAPVFLPIGDNDYWYFAAKEGGELGYHAWHSTNMMTWTYHGQVSESHWLTTAEYADGQFYFYFDQPNDQDPHLILDRDLTDGDLNNTLVGKVLDDPSHGSDAGVLRDEDGTFHLIYEDWSPVDARTHSWDSPLAGHADSDDGIHGFAPHEHTPPIDERTEGTGVIKEYPHRAGDVNNKKHNPTGVKLRPFTYEVHTPDQNAYGDFSLIKVGDQYYIFCDFDPVEGPMRVGCWTSTSINQQFTWSGSIGSDFHPDPTVGFAEGQFYLLVQRADVDFVSSGPWNNTVEARAGVDSNGDGAIDTWTEWTIVRETYARKPGFARIVERAPAMLDLAQLPKGTGFQFEYRITPADAGAPPVIDTVWMELLQTN
ncbi:MAG: hypothetical protein VB855_16240 [Pirellulaceae bacterium]